MVAKSQSWINKNLKDHARIIFEKKFPPHKTSSFKRQITTFTQKPEKTLNQCCDRHKELLNICPHYGFKAWRLVSYFYEGLTYQSKYVVEIIRNNKFRDKSPKNALDYLGYIANTTLRHN